MSSHPAACLAAAKAFGGNKHTNPLHYDSETHCLFRWYHLVPTDFIRDNANSVMKQSPIEYVRKAVPRGKLFEPYDASGVISFVYTDFFVDHTEPLEALRWVRQEGPEWPLSELLDGHEFLLIMETRHRSRSRSRSASKSSV